MFVPDDQAGDASLVLLVDEVDEADEILDDDRPPSGGRVSPGGASWSRSILLAVVAAAGTASAAEPSPPRI